MFKKKDPVELQAARENEIRYGITASLSQALKTLQKTNIGTDDQTVFSNEIATAVCNALEAALLHGIKPTAMKKLVNYMGLKQQNESSQDVNFWQFAEKFTHRDVISQLNHLGHITTEIGLCRAWVRMALNDCLVESYIDAMIADKKTLGYFYNRHAYLRDHEQPGILQTYLHGLMSFQFKLSYNASVLNQWGHAPLTLSGMIDTDSTPPPVIKPPISRPNNEVQEAPGSPASTVEVERIRSRSRGSSSGSDRRSNSSKLAKNHENPMETRQVGHTSDSSYFVSRSDFTTQDVEDFKRLGGLASSPMAVSECSSSSHVSCPDPPQLNVSPSKYVTTDEMFRNRKGTRDSTDFAEGRTFENNGLVDDDAIEAHLQDISTLSCPTAVGYDDRFSDSKFVESHSPRSAISPSLPVDKETMGAKSIFSPANVEIPADELINFVSPVFGIHPVEGKEDVKSERTLVGSRGDNDSDVVILEEGPAPDDVKLDEDTKKLLEESTKLLDLLDIQPGESDVTLQASASSQVIYTEDDNDQTEVKGSSNVRISSNGQDEIDSALLALAEKRRPTEDNAVVDRVISESGVANEERERGSCTGGRPSELTVKNLHQFSEDMQRKKQMSTSRADTKDKEREPSSLGKKKKEKKKGKMERLRPELSPPRSGVIQAELSDATADTVVTIPHSSGLTHSRLSLPNIALHLGDRSGKRTSMPNVLEDCDEDKESRLHNIYDGKPLPSEIIASSPSVGNSLVSGRGWSSSFDSEVNDTVEPMSLPTLRHVATAIPITRQKSESFNTMLQNYTPSSSLSAPSIDDVLHNFPQSEEEGGAKSMGCTSPDSAPNDQTDTPLSDQEISDQLCGEFEIVTSTDTAAVSQELQLHQLHTIANEQGLDAQNFQCKGCKRPIGLIYGKPRVCVFDGGYYCFECHENDEFYIPAFIIHNWDFRKQKVAKKNLEFLQEVEDQPRINVIEANPRLIDHVSEMKEVMTLRFQLIYLKTYLFSCKQSIAEDLRRLVWPRDYLYESAELFTLADLLQVPTGALAASIKKVIKFASKHVYGCRLCSLKGFICELCNNPKVIYAFEIEETVRCLRCKSVFHKSCKTVDKDCPKCYRRILRESRHGLSPTDCTDYGIQHSSA